MQITGFEVLVKIRTFNSLIPTEVMVPKISIKDQRALSHQRSKNPMVRHTGCQTLANFNGNIYNIPRARLKDGLKQQNSAKESFSTSGRLEMELRADQ